MPKSTIEVLTAQLSVDLRRYERGFQRAQRTTDKRLLAMEKRFDKGVDRMAKSGDRMAAGFNRAIASIGVGLAIRKVSQLSDAWTEATNKIRSAEVSFGGQLASVSDINVIANETRANLSSTVDLYSRLARAGGKLGKTQDEVAKATEVANKAFKAGGATIAEQNSAILQLSQGLQSGALQGEELRAIRENAPLLAEAIADAMGVSVGELKKLGAEGKITGDIIFDALVGGAQKIQDQFAVTTPTIAESFTILRNEGAEFVSTMDDGIGAAQALSKFIIAVANNLDLLSQAAVIATAAIGGAKLGLAMANFAVSMRATNLLLARATTQLGALNVASLLAARGITRLNVAFKAVGGPYALIFGGIALVILEMVKASKAAAEEQAKFKQNLDDAATTSKKYSDEMERAKKILAELGGDADDAAPKVNGLVSEYESLADAIERVAKAKRDSAKEDFESKISELKSDRDIQQGRFDGLSQKLEPIGFDVNSDPSKAGFLHRGDVQKLKDLQAGIDDADAKIAALEKKRSDYISQTNDELAAELLLNSKNAQAKLDAEQKLRLARASNDKDALQAIEDEKFLREEIVKLTAAQFGNSQQDVIDEANKRLADVQAARKQAEAKKPKRKGRTKKERTPAELAADRERLDIIGKINTAQAAGDEAQLAALRERLELSRLIADYREAGLSESSARQIASAQLEGIRNAEQLRQQREQAVALSERELELDLQAAAIRGDGAEVERLSRIIELREREADLRALGLSDAEASARAEEEQKQLAVAVAIAEKNYELERELEFKLLLAQGAGNTAEEERLQRELDLLRRKNQLIAEGKDPGRADKEQIDLDKAHLEGQIRDVAKGGFRAAIDGEFGDYLKDKLSSAADSMFDRAIDNLLDSLFSQIDLGGLFGGGGGGLGGLFGGGGAGGGLGGIFAGLFDTGGNIKRGQFGIVGEKGPEIVQGPAHITGRADTAQLMRSRPDRTALQPPSRSGGEMVFNYNPVIDASGADPAAIARLETSLAKQRQEFVPNIQKYFKEREQGLYR